ncbi:pyridoxal phosphate-dependent transferase [Parachaetomium inaequale]|uniref:Kynureninase n=1 Tax=Parachaetomium inaequale TaxID=2588326 RepID=A0AAN6PF28_9PEZI|nr:pyridoxal phosphate-dependent transferase [Parachaetomium inaequale]
MDAEYQSFIKTLRAGHKPEFPADAKSIEYARLLDAQDKLSFLRANFNIPTRSPLRKRALDGTVPGAVKQLDISNGTKHVKGDAKEDAPSIYFVGNSLGAQPKCVRQYLNAQLETWASIGVNGHFTSLDNSPLTAWQDMAADCAQQSLDLVGAASASEVIYMNTLTVNLHLMMASFYRPTERRHKIIAEWKPFPSDSYAIASQLQWHGLSPSTSLVEIHPDPETMYISTEHILSVIDEHADSTALLLLPGIQYYTGQLFNIPLITSHARARGITVGWDLAHAVGNAELFLHAWDVDFAVWCTYKYLNAGPGAIAGAFVHERHHHHGHHHHSTPDPEKGVDVVGYLPRLAGWYGADKTTRFNMDKVFRPAEGAHGWQMSNPSVVDLACVRAALAVFGQTDMRALRDKAVVLTGYLEWLLMGLLKDNFGEPAFRIITPGNPLERGSHLSLLLRPGLLDRVSETLAAGGVVVDVRKPDVIRVAPVPMYCRFEDVWGFIEVLKTALEEAR